MPTHTKCFPGTPGFSGVHSEKAALIPGKMVLKCIEEGRPFPWPIKSLDLREKQHLKTRSLSLTDYCLLNKAITLSS